MKIILSGSTGFIGQYTRRYFEACQHTVVCLPRSALENPFTYDPTHLENSDVVIHLAGESVAKKFWTEKRKTQIRSSRVEGTKNLIEIIKKLKTPPKAYLGASAMGYYGSGEHTDKQKNFHCPRGFLSSVCLDWEAAAEPLKHMGLRVCFMRFSHVLAKSGGLLFLLIKVARFGLSTVLGSGRQRMSWIWMNDLLRAIDWLIKHENLSGAFNFASPDFVTQRQFIKSLAKKLHRPVFLRLPASLLKFFMRQMARELLLVDLVTAPERLIESGFIFQADVLDKALSVELDS